jgi:hypothetical protein
MYMPAPQSKINPVVPMGPCGYSGVGCAGMGGLTMDGSGLFGTGIFGTGVDVTNLSTWGIPEYGAALFGLFVAFSLFSTTKQGVQGARKSLRRRRAVA